MKENEEHLKEHLLKIVVFKNLQQNIVLQLPAGDVQRKADCSENFNIFSGNCQ